jgi:hypothetical protein
VSDLDYDVVVAGAGRQQPAAVCAVDWASGRWEVGAGSGKAAVCDRLAWGVRRS